MCNKYLANFKFTSKTEKKTKNGKIKRNEKKDLSRATLGTK